MQERLRVGLLVWCATMLSIASVTSAVDDDLISISLDDVRLEDTLRMFSNITGAGTFTMHESVPRNISVTVNKKDKPWREVLQPILDKHQLYLQEPLKKGTPYLVTAVKPTKKTKMDAKALKELHAKTGALLSQLGAKDYKARRNADNALRQLPDEALEQMQDHLKSARDPEVKVRLKEIIDLRSGPRVTEAALKSMVIPEIEFRQASVKDCLEFLETAGNKKFKIDANFAGRAPATVTFSARQISVHEALDIITQIAELQFSIQDGIVVVE